MIIPEAYSNIGPEFNIPQGLAFASETFSRSQKRPRKRKSQKETATHSASKTSDCAPNCRTSKQRQFNSISNNVETRCFRKFSRRSKHHVTHRTKIFSTGSLLRESVRLDIFYAGPATAFKITPRSGMQRKDTPSYRSRKPLKSKRQRRRKPQTPTKRDLFSAFQSCIFLPDYQDIDHLVRSAAKATRMSFTAEVHAPRRGKGAEFQGNRRLFRQTRTRVHGSVTLDNLFRLYTNSDAFFCPCSALKKTTP